MDWFLLASIGAAVGFVVYVWSSNPDRPRRRPGRPRWHVKPPS